VTIKVSIYNERHLHLLQHSGKYGDIAKIIESGLPVNEDLWTYALFKEQRDRDGFRTFDNFRQRLAKRIQLFDDYIDPQSDTITAIEGNPGKTISEYVGVGTALLLVSTIHGLTEADWELIPETHTKDLDYLIASDGEIVVEVECKGTYEGRSRSTMRKSIEEKKQAQRGAEQNDHLLYGVITSYCSDPSKRAHAELLDPTAVPIYDDPLRARLMNRLKYYLVQFSVFSQAHFLIALSQRINALRFVKDYESLDGVGLVNRYGEPFDMPISLYGKKLFAEHDEIIGDIFPIEDGNYLFCGLSQNAVPLLISQKFQELFDYREIPQRLRVHTSIKPSSGGESTIETEPIALEGALSLNSAGRYVGILYPI
jgi:hypothetical protein